MRITPILEAPPQTMHEAIAALKEGEGIMIKDTTQGSVKTTAYNVRQQHPERRYRYRPVEGGVRIWRREDQP
jgi:hypothetical protein